MKNMKFIPFILLFLIFTLSVGFSVFNRNLMIKDLGAQIRIIKDIRITNITPNGSTSDGLAMSEDYNVSNITPNFSLPNADSTVTYTVEVTNIGNTVMGISNITGCPSNLVYTISNYSIGDPICDNNDSNKCSLGAKKTFDITFSYADGEYNSNDTDFNVQLDFTFGRFYNVTYINAPRGNSYKTVVLENTEFVQTGIPHGGGIARYTASGTNIAGVVFTSGGKVTVPADKVNNDITIRFNTLGEHINKLYADGTKSTVNNGTNVITYNRVVNQYLINDREGGNVDPDNGNVRYYGVNAGNYIYYNCSDYSNQSDSTCEKWRIIGVFNGKVKIIRDGSIGNYSVDSSNNKWSTSAIRKLLNSGFEGESVNNSLYWNRGSGKCYTSASGLFQKVKEVDCDFTSIGLKNDDTKNFITTETLHFTSPTSALRSIGNLYTKEHGVGTIYSGNDKTFVEKVALPYPSDYYFSADLSSCNADVYWLGTSCSSTSWMKQSSNMWTLTPGASGAGNMWYIKTDGGANYNDVYEGYSILPTLYLNENTIFIDGDGSSGNPYKIYPLA